MNWYNCAACQKANDDEKKVNRCAGCQSVYYCNAECQKSHWKGHKSLCKVIKNLAKDNTGFAKTIITEGNGEKPKAGQEVTVHYTGTLPSGTEFDSSRGKNKPFKFVVGTGQVIRGWDEGVIQMSKGERAQLVCSPEYAYGAGGSPPVIPPNATLVFDVELIDFENAEMVKTGTNFL